MVNTPAVAIYEIHEKAIEALFDLRDVSMTLTHEIKCVRRSTQAEMTKAKEAKVDKYIKLYEKIIIRAYEMASVIGKMRAYNNAASKDLNDEDLFE